MSTNTSADTGLMLEWGMGEKSGQAVHGRLIEILGLCILGIMLVAGLWPFRAPKNRVKWLANNNGLQFTPNSVVASTAAFHSKGLKDASGSVEIWLVPGSIRNTNTILSFDGSDHPEAIFLLRQYKDEVIVRQAYVDKYGAVQIGQMAVGNAIREADPLFVAITMGERDTSIYLNGKLRETFAMPGTLINSLTGRLVVGDSLQGRDSWIGAVLGLAVYGSQLTPFQVAEHYSSWTGDQKALIRENESPAALYLFNERQGNVVLNHVDSTNNLTIPERYFALHPPFLSSVMRDYHPTWAYWLDIGLNIIGFIPCGFVFAILWSEVRIVKHPFFITISVGLLISLTIEIGQAFLPTRSSGSTDLITNTLGTMIGVIMYRSGVAESLLIRLQQQFGTSVKHPGHPTAGAPSESTMHGIYRA